jgi:hypothetical protein
MKSLLLLLLPGFFFCLLPAWAAELPADFRVARLGVMDPDFRLQGIDGKDWTRADFAAAEVLKVYFTSNHGDEICLNNKTRLCRIQQLTRDHYSKNIFPLPHHSRRICLMSARFSPT